MIQWPPRCEECRGVGVVWMVNWSILKRRLKTLVPVTCIRCKGSGVVR